MKVYEVIVGAVVAEGVRDVFTIMGDSNMNCLVALEERGVRLISARHEGGAVAMADGYARATGQVGVASTTCGPGLTQIATQLMVASRARLPIVVFTGDTPTRSNMHLQDMDQRRFVESCEAGFVPIRSVDTAAADVRAAFRRARRERRPIVLDGPKDMQLATYPWDVGELTAALEPQMQYLSPQKDLLESAADIVVKAKRPVILVGQGAIQSDARESVLSLARLSGALISTTLLAKSWLNDDPYFVGVSGAFSSAVAEDLFSEADLVIAVGSSLNYFTTEGGLLYPNARYLWINLEEVPRAAGRRDDYFLQGDADTIVRSLVQILSERGHRADGFRTGEVKGRFLPWSGTTEDILRQGVEPRHAVRIVDRFVREDDLIVVGIGHYWSFPIQYMQGPPAGFIFTHQFGAIGQCLSTAIGVAIGRPEKRVIAFEGDGSLMMHLPELETAARNNVPLLVVVLNDEALGAELHHLVAEGIESMTGAAIPTPPLADVATSFGCMSATAYTEDEVETAMKQYVANPAGPFLLDIRVSRSRSDPLKKLTFGMENAAPHQGKPSPFNADQPAIN